MSIAFGFTKPDAVRKTMRSPEGWMPRGREPAISHSGDSSEPHHAAARRLSASLRIKSVGHRPDERCPGFPFVGSRAVALQTKSGITTNTAGRSPAQNRKKKMKTLKIGKLELGCRAWIVQIYWKGPPAKSVSLIIHPRVLKELKDDQDRYRKFVGPLMIASTW